MARKPLVQTTPSPSLSQRQTEIALCFAKELWRALEPASWDKRPQLSVSVKTTVAPRVRDISLHQCTTKFFCKWKERCLYAPYRGSSPAPAAGRAPYVGHATIWDGQENERHTRLGFERTASHCYHQALLAATGETRPCAGASHRCTNLALGNFITYDPV